MFLDLTLCLIPYLLPLGGTVGRGEWVLWSVHHTVVLLQLPPRKNSFPCSSVFSTGESPPCTPPVWFVLMGYYRVPPRCHLSGTDCSNMGPLEGHRSCQKSFSSVRFPEVHNLLWVSPCSSVRSSLGCMWISAP